MLRLYVRLQRLLAGIIVVCLALAATGIAVVMTRPPARQIAMFDGGVPGTAEASEALHWAHESGVDAIINYSVINADPAQIGRYLQDADALQVKIIVSLKDLLGPGDLDPDPQDVARHALYGANNDERVDRLVHYFEAYPAVGGYFIADELPDPGQTPDQQNDWYGYLIHRYDQVKHLTSKPVIASFTNADRNFLTLVKRGTEQLMMDYYPYPEGPDQQYGRIAHIARLASDVHVVAGYDSWFAIQAFSYYVSEPDMVKRFNFPALPPGQSGAPSYAEMTEMARLALRGGVRHLAFFSYEYAKQANLLEDLALAIKEVRAMPEFG